jgi:hypothetical protein
VREREVVGDGGGIEEERAERERGDAEDEPGAPQNVSPRTGAYGSTNGSGSDLGSLSRSTGAA